MTSPYVSPTVPELVIEDPAPGLIRLGVLMRDSAPLGFTLITLIALFARVFGISRSLELWVDEMVYTQLSVSVSHGQLPNILGVPFFLHPPGAFIIYGAAIKIFGLSGLAMSIVFELRWVSAVLGAFTVGLGFLLARRIAGPGIAWICAILLAFDPFVIRNNGRVFLETPATIFIVGGYLLLSGSLHRAHARPPRMVLIFTGLLFGYGILTKDIFVLMTIAPVILAGLWRATLPWREVGWICCAAVVPYVSYIILVSSDGFFGAWLQAKETGFQRMIGLQQTTGFNAPGAPSLVDRMLVQIGQFGTSYVLLILCPIVGVIAARSRYSSRRLIGLCALAMGLFGLYTALFGTFEEQYGYGVMIMSILGLGIVLAELCESRPERKALLSAATAILMILTIALGVREEVTPDDGFLQARAWVQAHLPGDARVGVTSNTAQWAFMNDPRFGVWPSAADMLRHQADYILTQSLPTSEGYGYARPEMLTWLEAHAVSVFSFSGPTNGNLVLWYVRPSLLERAANAGIGS